MAKREEIFESFIEFIPEGKVFPVKICLVFCVHPITPFIFREIDGQNRLLKIPALFSVKFST